MNNKTHWQVNNLLLGILLLGDRVRSKMLFGRGCSSESSNFTCFDSSLDNARTGHKSILCLCVLAVVQNRSNWSFPPFSILYKLNWQMSVSRLSGVQDIFQRDLLQHVDAAGRSWVVGAESSQETVCYQPHIHQCVLPSTSKLYGAFPEIFLK